MSDWKSRKIPAATQQIKIYFVSLLSRLIISLIIYNFVSLNLLFNSVAFQLKLITIFILFRVGIEIIFRRESLAQTRRSVVKVKVEALHSKPFVFNRVED